MKFVNQTVKKRSIAWSEFMSAFRVNKCMKFECLIFVPFILFKKMLYFINLLIKEQTPMMTQTLTKVTDIALSIL